MKERTKRNYSAFTLLELLAVIACVLLVVFFLLPRLARASRHSAGVICVNNLKYIGVAYRIWAGDNDVLVPPQQIVAKGGWADFLTNADQGRMCASNYAIMQNELGQWPRWVVCPKDERLPATNFGGSFNNMNVSYFVGVSANDLYPQSIMAGDRNLGLGLSPDPNYGWSPANGAGNDVAVSRFGRVGWSLKMHSEGNAAGLGDILLGDGSAQQMNTGNFRRNWLNHATPTTNWPAGHLPTTPSIRLVFP